MAPAVDDTSTAGTASYDSDTMSVGDGTWDFTKNSFLLPNLEGLNFETMRYNGMGNRFSDWPEYHRLVAAHAILAAMVFLFLVPVGIFAPRFMRSARKGKAWHSQMLIFGGLLLTASFMLGFFAVGPKRALTNPHHGIGVALYVMYACYLLGDRIVAHINKDRSLRLYIHMWMGRCLTLLGIIQVPLGLTLYGSPLVLFILYAVYTGMLIFFYLCMDFLYGTHGGRTPVHEEFIETHVESKHKGERKWLAPLGILAGTLMIKNLRSEKKHERDRSPGRSRSRSRMRSRSYSRSRIGTSDLTSRRDSDSHLYSKPAAKSGGFWSKMMTAGAAIGGAKVASSMLDSRRRSSSRRRHDEEYSAVSTELSSQRPPYRSDDTSSYFTEMQESRAGTSRITDSRYGDSRYTVYTDSRVTAPSGTAYTGAGSSMVSAPVRPVRPVSGRRSDSRRRSQSRARSVSRNDRSRLTYIDDDDGYESPSRVAAKKASRENIAKGFLGGMGMGWIANKFRGPAAPAETQHLHEDDDLRSGVGGSRYTRDTSPRRPSSSHVYDHNSRNNPAASSYFTEDASSELYSQGPTSTMPPSAAPSSYLPYSEISAGPSTMPPSTAPPRRSHEDRGGRNRHYVDSEVSSRERLDSLNSLPSRFARRNSSTIRRANEADARERVSSVERTEAEHMTRTGRTSQPPHRRSDEDDSSSSIVVEEAKSGHVDRHKVDNEKDRLTIRRRTEEESTRARKDRSRRDSMSSMSGDETPTRRYRRDSNRGAGNEQRSYSRRPGSRSKETGPLNDLDTRESQESMVSPSANGSLADNNRRRRRMERRQTVTSADYTDQ